MTILRKAHRNVLTNSYPTDHTPTTRYAQRRLTKHSFGWESSLVDVLCSKAGQFRLKDGHYEVRKEWVVSNRIADVAISTYKSHPQMEPRLRSLTRLTMIELAVLAGTVPEACDEGQLATRFYLRREVVGVILTRLKRLGLIHPTSNEAFGPVQATNWRDALPTSLHLIEAKIEDWEQAVSQAANYRRFCDSASVALPLSFAGRSDVYSACEARGVGLILLHADGKGVHAVDPDGADPKWKTIKTLSYVEILRDFALKIGHVSSVLTGIEH